jgi:hypothetical protein
VNQASNQLEAGGKHTKPQSLTLKMEAVEEDLNSYDFGFDFNFEDALELEDTSSWCCSGC